MPSAKDRRFLRRAVQVTFRVRDAEDPAQGDLLFDAVDLSQGGAFLRSDLLFDAGQELGVTFELPDPERSVNVRARVAWATRADHKGAPGMGISFVDLAGPDREAIAAFVKKWR
ncbi:MAG: PilZ domain-containing protein [Deltaproteobacteria bacterium]|nr:PilZ domain-containing protein [Deltaproteobacteria bacterium]